MTKQDYIDPKRFPHTTHPGLDTQGQLFLDAHLHDEFKRLLASAAAMSESQKACYVELDEKSRFRAALLAEILDEKRRYLNDCLAECA